VIAHKEIEAQDNSSVKLNVTIEKDALKEEYDKLLKDYSKKAHIKGFRKGKVPASVLEKKFGDSIKQEASANCIEKSLKEIFDEIEEKPLPYSTPELQDELEPDLEQDLSFSVVYDVFPDIQLGEYKGLTVEVPQVSVTKEDEDREIQKLQDRNAMVVDKKDGVVEKDSIVTIDYAELDENDTIIEETKREGFVFTVGTGYNLYKIDDDVEGMKKDEEKIIEKEYGDDFEYEELRGKKVRLNVKVTAVKEKELPELDDDFAQDISEDYQTIDDLKADIKKRLEETKEARVREKTINALMDRIIENSSIELPQSMVNMELENSWQNFLGRYRMPEEQLLTLLQHENKDKNSILEEWRPSVEKNLRARLLIDKMIEEENIEISDNEVEEEMQKYADESNKSLDEVKEEISKGNSEQYLRYELKQRKLFDSLIEQADTKKGEKMKFLDLIEENH
jgi:trigger factor